MSDEQGKTTAGDGDERPGEAKTALRKGVSLLWHAARTVARDIKRELDKANIREHVRAAKHEIGQAASAAAKEIEHFVQRGQPRPPRYSDEWPPPPAGEPPQAAEEPIEPPPNAPSSQPKPPEPRDPRLRIEED